MAKNKLEKELVVNDGNTYIQIYPTNGGKLTMN